VASHAKVEFILINRKIKQNKIKSTVKTTSLSPSTLAKVVARSEVVVGVAVTAIVTTNVKAENM